MCQRLQKPEKLVAKKGVLKFSGCQAPAKGGWPGPFRNSPQNRSRDRRYKKRGPAAGRGPPWFKKIAEHLLNEQQQHVGHGHLFEQAQREQLERAHGARGLEPVRALSCGRMSRARQIGPAVMEPKSTKRPPGRRGCARGQIAPAHVDQVAQGGEGVKADAQRSGQAVQRAGRKGKKRQNQVIIFEKGQHQKQKGRPRTPKPAPGERRGLDGQPEAPHKHAACACTGAGAAPLPARRIGRRKGRLNQ